MAINGANNVSITLQFTLTSGATTLILPTGKGALLSGAITPLRGVIEEYNTSKIVVKREIIAITGISGDQLTITRAAEPCPIGESADVQQQVAQVFANPTSTKISVVMTKGMIDDINTSISTLGSTKLNSSGGLRTGLSANRVLGTDASGNEIVVSGASGQVLGFGAGGALIAVSQTVDIGGLTTASNVLDTDEYLQYNQTAGANRKVTGKTLRARARNFGGTGADGAVNGTSNITIPGTNSTYIVRNYSSWSAASGGAKTLTITPTNCILHIKIKGDADFTGWVFEGNGKGGQGSAGAIRSTSPGAPGESGLSTVGKVLGGYAAYTYNGTNFQSNQGEGGNSQSSGYSYVVGVSPTVFVTTSPELSVATLAYLGRIGVSCGGGGSGASTVNSGDSNGNGGHGGYAIIVEVGGNVIFSSTTINAAGIPGTPFNIATNLYGGAGAGGTALILHGGSRTGTPTINVSGGTQAGGNPGKNGSFAIISLDDIS